MQLALMQEPGHLQQDAAREEAHSPTHVTDLLQDASRDEALTHTHDHLQQDLQQDASRADL